MMTKVWYLKGIIKTEQWNWRKYRNRPNTYGNWVYDKGGSLSQWKKWFIQLMLLGKLANEENQNVTPKYATLT